MRVQLQRQQGATTLLTVGIALKDDGDGVSTERLIAALTTLRGHNAIPNSEQRRADAAFRLARNWIRSRPPNGIAGTVRRSFYFEPLTPGHSFRFDIENLAGINLRR